MHFYFKLDIAEAGLKTYISVSSGDVGRRKD